MVFPVGVDLCRHHVAVAVRQIRCGGVDPAVVSALVVVGAFTQDHQVGHSIRPGQRAVRARGKPHGADEISALEHLPARGGVLRVEGVSAGEYRDETARAGEIKALDDEVVVDRVLACVVVGVVQRDPTERHVADHRIEGVIGKRRGGETFRAHPGRRVQHLRDTRRRGVEFDTRHTQLIAELHRCGRARQERPRATPRFEHLPARELKTDQRLPHHVGVLAGRVVRVQRRPARSLPLASVEQFTQPSTLSAVARVCLVEDLRHRTPRRPLCQRGAILCRRFSPRLLEAAHNPDRLEVGLDAPTRAGRNRRDRVRGWRRGRGYGVVDLLIFAFSASNHSWVACRNCARLTESSSAIAHSGCEGSVGIPVSSMNGYGSSS